MIVLRERIIKMVMINEHFQYGNSWHKFDIIRYHGTHLCLAMNWILTRCIVNLTFCIKYSSIFHNIRKNIIAIFNRVSYNATILKCSQDDCACWYYTRNICTTTNHGNLNNKIMKIRYPHCFNTECSISCWSTIGLRILAERSVTRLYSVSLK